MTRSEYMIKNNKQKYLKVFEKTDTLSLFSKKHLWNKCCKCLLESIRCMENISFFLPSLRVFLLIIFFHACPSGHLIIKDTDIFYKIISWKCSWVRQLFDENFHEWKIIILYLFRKVFRTYLKFHSNLDISKCPHKIFPLFYQEILMG